MIRKFKTLCSRLMNYCYWKRYPKYIIFESDDWGSIRSSDKSAVDTLDKLGYLIDKSHYINDCIESPEDLHNLSKVLKRHKDVNGNSAIFTANVVLANPNFDKIEQLNFSDYYYKPVHQENILFDGPKLVDTWSKLMSNGVFMPQVHCREHMQWWSWMEDLRTGKPDAIDTFSLHMCGVPKASSPNQISYFEPVYVSGEAINDGEVLESIKKGFDIFESIFGFKSLTTIAPVAYWNDIHEEMWSSLGVKGIQCGWLQAIRDNGVDKHRVKILGQKNTFKQSYLVRNCLFEPRRSEKLCGVDQCLSSIQRAFFFGKPAIISTHRFNYVSGIDEVGSKEALESLDRLLTKILLRWPDVRFISSPQLLEKLN